LRTENGALSGAPFCFTRADLRPIANKLAIIWVGIVLHRSVTQRNRHTYRHIGTGAAQPPSAGGNHMLNDREKILTALREKPLKIFEVMKRANLPNHEACQAILLKMRDEGSVKFDIHKGQWHIG
jgi:hypothetical protein